MNRFVTTHVLVTLGMHNLNRDGNGLPKSQFDGGVQRARLSSQAIKRGARTLYREAGFRESIRSRLGALETVRRARDIATSRGVDLDLDKAIDSAVTSIRSLYAGDTDAATLAQSRKRIKSLLDSPESATSEPEPPSADDDGQAKKDTIAYLSLAELDALATSIVQSQAGGEALTTDFIQDARSASLDIAAFGRMFAEQPNLGTQAAVAVSQATTVHQMQLVTDYFTAVEDLTNEDVGAAHIGENYFTSGTYYRTFTIDVDQLARSWSAFDGPDARHALSVLVRSLILALPSGKVNGTNASVLPKFVLAENQNFRVAYGFDEPLTPGGNGGYTEPAVEELARERAEALRFDPSNFGAAVTCGDTFGADFQASSVDTLDDLVSFVVESVYEGR